MKRKLERGLKIAEEHVASLMLDRRDFWQHSDIGPTRRSLRLIDCGKPPKPEQACLLLARAV
jgi:hypothetical protein